MVKELQKHVDKDASKTDKVSPGTWYEYFQELLGNNRVDNTKNEEMLLKLEEMVRNNISEAMGHEITVQEIKSVIKNLKNNKAVALDNISN